MQQEAAQSAAIDKQLAQKTARERQRVQRDKAMLEQQRKAEVCASCIYVFLWKGLCWCGCVHALTFFW